jgi:hypothetical protein
MTTDQRNPTTCQCAALRARIGEELARTDIPVSWNLEGTEYWALQSGNDLSEERYRCRICGLRFILREAGSLTLDSVAEPESTSPPAAAPAPASDGAGDGLIERYLGKWTDARGRALIVRRGERQALEVDYLLENGRPADRSMLNGAAPSLALPAQLKAGVLQLELGTPGLGPTMRLRFPDLTSVVLEPTVAMGLYDDYEGDLGVPWVFPLLEWRRP